MRAGVVVVAALLCGCGQSSATNGERPASPDAAPADSALAGRVVTPTPDAPAGIEEDAVVLPDGPPADARLDVRALDDDVAPSPDLRPIPDAPPLPPDAPPDGEPADPRYEGLVSITLKGDPMAHPGVLVATDSAVAYSLVLTSMRWLDWKTPVAGVSVAAPAATPVQFISNHDDYATAVLQLAPLPGRPYPFDAQSDAALMGMTVTCLARDPTGRRIEASGAVTEVVSNALFFPLAAALTIPPGAPCLSAQGTLVGIATEVQTGRLRVQRISIMQRWIEGMKDLATVRKHPRTKVVALYNLPSAGATARMCLDLYYGSVDWGASINQYPCHYAHNQRFWLDYRTDDKRPALMVESSGLCLDVYDGSTMPGGVVQQWPCHGGANQHWEITPWSATSADPVKLRPVQALANDLCLSVAGGPSASSNARAEQRPCAPPSDTTNADQRWYMIVNPAATP